MKKHIIALLAISAIGLASCGTQKEVTYDVPPPPPPVNPTLEWRKTGEFVYAYKQNFAYAEQLLQRSMNRNEAGLAIFIDVPFVLYDQETMNRYFDGLEDLNDLTPGEAQSVSRFTYQPEAITFLQMCSEIGVQIYLMAPEEEILPTIQDLAKKNVNAMPSLYEKKPQYGKYGRNITMQEMADSDKIALILTTSLGEATALTGMGSEKGDGAKDLFRMFGDKIILFPNPAFN